jgi:hypothetical protein
MAYYSLGLAETIVPDTGNECRARRTCVFVQTATLPSSFWVGLGLACEGKHSTLINDTPALHKSLKQGAPSTQSRRRRTIWESPAEQPRKSVDIGVATIALDTPLVGSTLAPRDRDEDAARQVARKSVPVVGDCPDFRVGLAERKWDCPLHALSL